jgi:hypothetical protein
MIYRKVIKCDVFKLQISCQKHNLKWLYLDYIYRISYKNAKRPTPEKGFALLKNDITSSELVSKLKIYSRNLQ